ncbi:hypothetical protein FRB99_005924 [Tulasnella sp. 403]|nr:hypothetical protein FRB99_005924 [Tulasnella sp. 403]
MDAELHCNIIKCRKQLSDKAVVTTCSHIFCIECASLSFTNAQLCPACETTLTEENDVVMCSLQPTNDYKTSVLSGLSPALILEICKRGVSFWQYQCHQESAFQAALLKNANERNATLSKQLENVIREANSEISLLNNKCAEMERELELERRKTRDMTETLKDRDKEYQKLKNQFDSIKRKALLAPNTFNANAQNNATSDVIEITENPAAPPRTRGIGFGAGMASGVSMGDVANGMDIQRTPLRPAMGGGFNAQPQGLGPWQQQGQRMNISQRRAGGFGNNMDNQGGRGSDGSSNGDEILEIGSVTGNQPMYRSSGATNFQGGRPGSTAQFAQKTNYGVGAMPMGGRRPTVAQQAPASAARRLLVAMFPASLEEREVRVQIEMKSSQSQSQRNRCSINKDVAESSSETSVMIPRSSRRLLSTLSSTSKSFPPPEALSSATAVKPFQPRIWASLQPPPTTALNAFASRIKLFETSPSERNTAVPPKDVSDMLTQALTHNSFLRLHSEHAPNDPPPRTNVEWEAMGNHLLGLFATEYVHATWPHLPTRVVKAAVTAFVGPQTCADVAREWGLTNMVRWSEVPREEGKRPVEIQDAYASVPRSVVALTYQQKSMHHARALVHKYFLSREVDLRPFIKFRNPMKALQETAKAFGRERPLSRLLKETGRFSISPMYVVGVYSGEDKLGEGFGSSLQMAEFRASEDVLRRLYLTQTPPHLLSLPSSTFPKTASSDPFGDLSKITDCAYAPGQLGECEVLYGSSSKQRGLTRRQRAEAGEASGRTVDPEVET